MKHLKTYEGFKYLKPKSDDDILKNIEHLSPKDLFLLSCENGFNKGIDISLSKGIDVNYHDGEGIKLSIENGHINTIKHLIEKGAKINIDDIFRSPLSYAVQLGDIEIMKILLDNGADPNHIDPHLIKELSDYIYVENNKEVLDLLVKYGMNLDSKITF